MKFHKMYQFTWKLRVSYADTDKMGYAYYGNYARYFEIARVEALRHIGISYKELEDEGVMLPVLDFSIRYYKPAFYDDEISIQVIMEELPDTRITFTYQTFDATGVQLNLATTTLVFVSIETKRPIRIPDKVLAAFKTHFIDSST